MIIICKKNLFCILTAVLVFSSIAYGQDSKKDKRSAFIQTVDILSEQVNKQIQDRDKLVATLSELSKTLKKAELKNLDRRITRVRSSEIEREALFMSETLIEQSKNFTIKTELIEYLRRIVVKDQQIYDDYFEQKSAVKFQLNKQLAKIRTEQTLLKVLQRDLQKLKLYPSNKENFRFFLESASKLLDGLNKAKQNSN